MKVDEKATQAARNAHAVGVGRLDELFVFEPEKVPLNAQTGRALETKADRRVWREWRDSTFPARVRRRRRRKIANASRRKNR